MFEAPGGIRQPDIQARIEKLLADAQALPGVVAVESPFGHGVTKIYALKQFADTPASTFQALAAA